MLLATAVSGWLSSPPSGVLSPTAPSRAARSRAAVMQEFDEKMYDYYANPEAYEGTSLTVTEYPNPVLRAVGAEIAEFDEKLNTLCEEMFTVMYASTGVGLAAPQVTASPTPTVGDTATLTVSPTLTPTLTPTPALARTLARSATACSCSCTTRSRARRCGRCARRS